MPRDTEYGTRARVMRVFRAIAESPNSYTRQELAHKFGCSRDTITGDILAIETAGFVVRQDEKYRYSFVLDQPMKRLNDLLHFSEEDRYLIIQALDNLHTTPEKQQRLKQKLASLYDFSRLGYANLRKPHLRKVDLLLQAKEEKRQVVLEGYRSSNSNTVSDRRVEPFHIMPGDDILHSFDVEKKELRHFRISRIERVRLLDDAWQFQGHHTLLLTDPFRIVNNHQEMVHLRLSVGAYNELVERYPLTKNYIEPAADPNFYDFQCRVNANFFGLTNFILGFYHLKIEVFEPDSLKVHLREAVTQLQF